MHLDHLRRATPRDRQPYLLLLILPVVPRTTLILFLLTLSLGFSVFTMAQASGQGRKGRQHRPSTLEELRSVLRRIDRRDRRVEEVYAELDRTKERLMWAERRNDNLVAECRVLQQRLQQRNTEYSVLEHQVEVLQTRESFD